MNCHGGFFSAIILNRQPSSDHRREDFYEIMLNIKRKHSVKWVVKLVFSVSL